MSIQDTYFEAGTSDMSAYEGSAMQERDEARRKLRNSCDHGKHGFHYSRDDADCIGCGQSFAIAIAADLEWKATAGPVVEKPTLGIKPRYLWDEERGADLARAIARYLDQGSHVPDEWMAELTDVVQRLNARIAAKAAEYRGPG